MSELCRDASPAHVPRQVGPEFNRNDVAFVFPLNSPLRKKVDSALLSMREDGTYRGIYDKWFGAG